MNSELLHMRLKGFTYATEPERMQLVADGLISFRGNHRQHQLAWVEDCWRCDCERFEPTAVLHYGPFCEHVIAVERILNQMHEPQPAAQPVVC